MTRDSFIKHTVSINYVCLTGGPHAGIKGLTLVYLNTSVGLEKRMRQWAYFKNKSRST
jgi:hypothetical protein